MKESSSTSHSSPSLIIPSPSPSASASASFSCSSSPPHNFDGSLVPPPPPPLSAPSSTSDDLLVKNDHQTLQGEEGKMEVEEKIEVEIPGATSLTKFCREDESELKFTDELKQILEVIALTGNYWHEWSMLKCLLSFRLKQVLTQYHELYIASGGQERLIIGETFPDLEKRLLECLDLFVDGPPFTLQRFCELLLNPTATYPNIDKVALAFEKLLLVTSIIPACKDPYPSHIIENKGMESRNQVEEMSIVAVENGAPDKTDEEMLEMSSSDDIHADGKNLPSEASLSLENSAIALIPKDDHGTEPDFERVQILNQQPPLMEDDLVDIPLDDGNPGT